MRRPIRSWLVVLLLGGTMAYALAEEITLTTYYLSPRANDVHFFIDEHMKI